MNVEIRLATNDDIPALKELIRESVTRLSAEYYTPRQIASALTYVFLVDTQLIQDQTYFVAKAGNQISGSGGWSRRKKLFGGDPEDQIGPFDPETEAARIRAFYVHPDWSRKGIGSKILRACEDAAQKAGFKRIELLATLPGEPLYSAKGYERGEAFTIEMSAGESLATFRMTKILS